MLDNLLGAFSGSVKTHNYAQDALSAANKDNWGYYKSTFQPLATQMSDMTSGVARQNTLNRSLADFDQSMLATSGIQDRNMQRFGTTNSTNSRLATLRNQAQRNSMYGNTAYAVDDMNYGLLAGLADQGAKINGQATNVLQNTASYEAQRNAAAKGLAQQAQAGLVNMGTSMLGGSMMGATA